MASYGDMRPRRPLIQGGPRSMYAGAGTQPAPQQAPPPAPATTAAPPADPLRFGPMRGGTPGPRGPTQAPRGPTRTAQNLGAAGAGSQAQAAPRAQPPVSAAGNAFGVGTTTPGVTAQQDQVAPRNVNTSGAVRQFQTAPPPGAPWIRPDAPKASFTPFMGSFTPATPQGDRDESGTPEGGKVALSGPPVRPDPSGPAAAPAGVEVAAEEPIQTHTSALIAQGGDGNPPTESDQGRIEVETEDNRDPEKQATADASGNSYEVLTELEKLYGSAGGTVKISYDDATGTTNVSVTYSDEAAQNGEVDFDRLGEDYDLTRGPNNEWIYTTRVSDGSMRTAEAEAARQATARGDREADANTQAFLDSVKEIMGLGSSEEDKKLLEDSVNESRNRFGYETGRNQLAAMEGSARAGLSADASAGTGAALGQAGGIAAAQDETKIRLENRRDQLAAQLQGLQLQAAFAANAVEREAATQAAMQLMKEQGRINRQLMTLQDELTTPSVGEAIGGFFGNLAGSLGDAASFGLARRLSR